ncbi:hypothetical protein HT574_04615 [Parageobacillus sp. VR-IP]|uniref:TcaA second domain-containing protein n=1 Tax=Parageobacillus sp. VR-IP TaxID=2742205 RepID=UPI00158199A1|nr:hypothetical protein [Parageobacillus sp. VR-IP]NUK29408.1 hypothetical protein [Parageobacillus sp. VR-IP]
MEQRVSLEKTIQGDNHQEREIKDVGSGAAALARYEQRKQARLFMRERRKKYYRIFLRTALAVAAVWIIGALLWKGYNMLKNAASREIAVMRLEDALKDKDVAALQTYLRVPDETIPVNEKTLAPLFSYLDEHPNAYETLERDFDRQNDMKHVYIKGLTSKPPIFTIKVFGDRYVFEPTLYSMNIRLNEPDDGIMINGEKVEGEPTKDPFVKKVGPYLPGVYTVTVVKADGEKRKKETKQVHLFGGARVYEVDLAKE